MWNNRIKYWQEEQFGKFKQKQWELRFQHEIVTEAEMTLKSDLREATDKLEEMKAENICLQETVEHISDKLTQASPGITPREEEIVPGHWRTFLIVIREDRSAIEHTPVMTPWNGWN